MYFNIENSVWLYHDDLRGELLILDDKIIVYKNIRERNLGTLFEYLIPFE